MTTRHLLALFDSIYVLAMALLVGSIVFFSFAVAPIIFRVLGAEAGGRFVRALFPRYYLWGAICGAIALPAFVAGPLCFPEYRGIAVGIQALMLLCCTLIMLYGGNSLVPEINRARDEGPSSHDRFERLHRRSVRLNALVLVDRSRAPGRLRLASGTPDRRHHRAVSHREGTKGRGARQGTGGQRFRRGAGSAGRPVRDRCTLANHDGHRVDSEDRGGGEVPQRPD